MAAGTPPIIRRCLHRTGGVITAALPPEYPAQQPATFRDGDGRLPNPRPVFIRQITGLLPPYFRRTSAVIAGAMTGQFPANSRRMPAVDPHLIRKPRNLSRSAVRVTEISSRAEEVIIELREKARPEAIAELLNRYGVKTSRTMVNEFVRILKQSKSTRQKAHLPSAAPLPAPVPHQPAPVSPPIAPVKIETNTNGVAKPRGPHIARVELTKQGEQHD